MNKKTQILNLFKWLKDSSSYYDHKIQFSDDNSTIYSTFIPNFFRKYYITNIILIDFTKDIVTITGYNGLASKRENITLSQVFDKLISCLSEQIEYDFCGKLQIDRIKKYKKSDNLRAKCMIQHLIEKNN